MDTKDATAYEICHRLEDIDAFELFGEGTFRYITKIETHLGGPHVEWIFPNGYGASVIRNDMTCGRFELAVIRDGRIDYTTPITDDVVEYLDHEEVRDLLDQVAKL